MALFLLLYIKVFPVYSVAHQLYHSIVWVLYCSLPHFSSCDTVYPQRNNLTLGNSLTSWGLKGWSPQIWIWGWRLGFRFNLKERRWYQEPFAKSTISCDVVWVQISDEGVSCGAVWVEISHIVVSWWAAWVDISDEVSLLLCCLCWDFRQWSILDCCLCWDLRQGSLYRCSLTWVFGQDRRLWCCLRWDFQWKNILWCRLMR